MIKIYEFFHYKFHIKYWSRIYCYKCRGDYTSLDDELKKHQKTILKRSIKLQTINLLARKCRIWGDDKCIDTLDFEHKNSSEK